MNDGFQPASSPAHAGRWLIWLAFVVVWTASLLSPQPVSLAKDVLPEDALLPSFKLAHVACYAFLTVLTGWLRAGRAARLWLLGFLFAHAVLTELLQHFVPGRTPSLADVCFDHAGILMGLALTHRWWWPSSPTPQPAGDPAPAAATARAPEPILPGRGPG